MNLLFVDSRISSQYMTCMIFPFQLCILMFGFFFYPEDSNFIVLSLFLFSD